VKAPGPWARSYLWEDNGNNMKTLLLALLTWNLITFLVTSYDKAIAGKRKRRIPEKNLMWMAALMGSVGVYAAMKIFRHKTKHAKFKYGVPILLVLNLLVVYLVVFRITLLTK
jgi:uncharacterized membrane protein YsdA (DUF1294 family)